VVVVMAAGNDGADNDLASSYPANFTGVISIGATRNTGVLADFSNYGYCVPIFAPGQNIYSTVPFGRFSSADGTSMAAPVATGVAALVKNIFPDYNAKQVYHQLRSTLKPISNGSNKKKYGKVEAFAAVTFNNPDFPNKVCPGVAVSKQELPPFNSFTSYNKKVLKLDFTNYIGKASNLTAKITSMDNMIDFDNSAKYIDVSLGEMNTLETKSVNVNVQLNSLAAISTGKTSVLIEYTDGTFYDFEVIYIPINISTPVTTINTTLLASSTRNSEYEVADVHHYDSLYSFAVGVRTYGSSLLLIAYNFTEINGTISPTSNTSMVVQARPTAV
jgi:hypothetical protein